MILRPDKILTYNENVSILYLEIDLFAIFFSSSVQPSTSSFIKSQLIWSLFYSHRSSFHSNNFKKKIESNLEPKLNQIWTSFWKEAKRLVQN